MSNPYQSPSPTPAAEKPPRQGWKKWVVWIWTAAGFAIGTAMATPLILSIDFKDQLAGGAIYGGLVGALLGFLNGRQRAGKAKQQTPLDVDD